MKIKLAQSMESCVVGKPYALVMRSIGSSFVVVPNKTCKHNVIHPVVLKWIDNESRNQDSIFHTCSVVEVYSEYRSNETLYWAHSNYQSMGPWHDWVMVTFANDDDDDVSNHDMQNKEEMYFQNDEFPLKILCFVVVDKEPEIHAIVQSCIVRDSEQDSILLHQWEKEYIRTMHQTYSPVFHVVPVESFGERVLFVEDNSTVRETIDQKSIEPGCTLVLPRQEYWAKQFLSID